MKIKDIHIRLCRHKQSIMKNSEMRDGKKSNHLSETLEYFLYRNK